MITCNQKRQHNIKCTPQAHLIFRHFQIWSTVIVCIYMHELLNNTGKLNCQHNVTLSFQNEMNSCSRYAEANFKQEMIWLKLSILIKFRIPDMVTVAVNSLALVERKT